MQRNIVDMNEPPTERAHTLRKTAEDVLGTRVSTIDVTKGTIEIHPSVGLTPGEFSYDDQVWTYGTTEEFIDCVQEFLNQLNCYDVTKEYDRFGPYIKADF